MPISKETHELVDGASVVVSGGCGFIGCQLTRRLADLGAKRVLVIDSLRYGKRENLDPLPAGVEIRQFTVGSDEPADLDLDGYDYFFHLAAEKHNQSKDSPQAVFRANIAGTHALMTAAADAGVRKTVFSSSLYAYGSMHAPAMVETDVPNPRTVYGISKLAGEHVLQQVCAGQPMTGTSLRYFFVYGPRQFAGLGYKSVIMKNFERILAGEPPVIFGDGEQALDYTYVDDVVDATIAALAPTADGEVINIGSGKATSINSLTEKMLGVARSDLQPKSGPADWTAGTSRFCDPSKAKRILDWQATTSFDEGLKSTLDWAASDHQP